VHLRIAGFTLAVTTLSTGSGRTDDPDLPLAPDRAAAHFLIDPASAPAGAHDLEIAVTMGDLGGDNGAQECLFDSGGTWRLHRHKRGLLFQVFSSTLPGIPYKTALLDPDFSRALVTLHRPFFAGEPTINPLEYPLDELLVITLLGRGHGIEIHGCGVIDGETGWLFAGSSGAGKTTTARLWLDERGPVILSDDRIVLRADADGVWMYGTPWHGDEPLASPRRARLDGIFFLRHHDRHVLTAVTPADAVARLFAASFPPFHDAGALDFTLGFLDRVARTVPCAELGFTPDRGAIDAVRGRGQHGRIRHG
jgi:hypothetical protein